MNTTFAARAAALSTHSHGTWAERALAQLCYVVKLAQLKPALETKALEDTLAFLEKTVHEQGCIPTHAAQEAEHMLLSYEKEAKAYTILCAAHAHIDMDWMWGTAETVAIVLDTFRTMLELMDEFPTFTFSQSQASVYRIVEEYDPALLEQIKRRVAEGRWEVTASAWVEADKNMPNGESLARHILYTKRYMNQLFGLTGDELKLDFEPDSFGHSRNIPEILTKGGVDYYYHCRGFKDENIYNWRAPSGKEVLVYLEPLWYNAIIDPTLALYAPEVCERYGIDTILKVYGVGNHGGGPTRRDIRRLMAMAEWPVYPTIRFGSFHEFFKGLEKHRDRFPVVDDELNSTMTGCYTSQSRIKMANRIGEKRLFQAEGTGAMALGLSGHPYAHKRYAKAWEHLLYNHFHDILPGSGVTETREAALAGFQQSLAIANTEAKAAMRAIAEQIDTAFVPYVEDTESRSEGAGVGHNVRGYGLPTVERGSGITRVFHAFNPLAYERTALVEMTVWDWTGEPSLAEFSLPDGTVLEHQLVEEETALYSKRGSFWGHKYMKALVRMTVPAMGYATCILREKPLAQLEVAAYSKASRVETIQQTTMENRHLRLTFTPGSPVLFSIIDKASGREMLGQDAPIGFRYIREETSQGMTAWNVGQHILSQPAGTDARIIASHIDQDALRQSIDIAVSFGDSHLQYRVSLDKDSHTLRFSVLCDWQEKPIKGVYVPQLAFALPLGYACKAYAYDVPFGVIHRQGKHQDAPGLSFACGVPAGGQNGALALISSTKYGFRCHEDMLSLTLIRSSYEPDPYPELGEHRFEFAVAFLPEASNQALLQASECFNNPCSFMGVSAGRKGTLPTALSFMSIVSGSAQVSSLKGAEDGGDDLVLRLYECAGADTVAAITFARPVEAACITDINEASSTMDGIQLDGCMLKVPVTASSVCTLKIRLSKA